MVSKMAKSFETRSMGPPRATSKSTSLMRRQAADLRLDSRSGSLPIELVPDSEQDKFLKFVNADFETFKAYEPVLVKCFEHLKKQPPAKAFFKKKMAALKDILIPGEYAKIVELKEKIHSAMRNLSCVLEFKKLEKDLTFKDFSNKLTDEDAKTFWISYLGAKRDSCDLSNFALHYMKAIREFYHWEENSLTIGELSKILRQIVGKTPHISDIS
jgi:hypothetical protein